jgi:hypothetical protein
MSCLKNYFFFIVFFLIIVIPWLPLNAESQRGHKSKENKDLSVSGSEKQPVYPQMPDPGNKVMIGKNYYFVYGFDKKPKMGTVIMKVALYTMEGKKDVTLEIKGDAGMPSMKGAHDTGDRPFKLSQKGVYLLPVDIVMPGDWEIRLTFLKDGKVIFRGSHKFNV